MPESFLEWLQQLDVSAFGDFGDLDWTNIATYSALLLAAGGAIWTSSKNFIQFLWSKTEGLVGFVISTVVVFSLWCSLLRIHASISFNLDKEIFDNFLWLSAILFTPYYLVHYGLLKGFVLTVVRSVELVLDLLVFSWFPQRAEQNRMKWRNRVKGVYRSSQDSIKEFWQMGLKAMSETRIPVGLQSSSESEKKDVPEDTQQDLARE